MNDDLKIENVEEEAISGDNDHSAVNNTRIYHNVTDDDLADDQDFKKK